MGVSHRSTLRMEYGETDEIVIEKGVRQGFILSPHFSMRTLGKFNNINIGGQNAANLRCADNTTLKQAKTTAGLRDLVHIVILTNEVAGLDLNLSNVMTTTDLDRFAVYGEAIEVVNSFHALGMLLTVDGKCEREVKRRIRIEKAAILGFNYNMEGYDWLRRYYFRLSYMEQRNGL